MNAAQVGSHMLWRAVTSFSGTLERYGCKAACQNLRAVASVQCLTSTSLRPHPPIPAVVDGFSWLRSAQPLQVSSHTRAQFVPIAASAHGCLISRGYKIITSGIVDLPHISEQPGGKGLKQTPRAISESGNRMTRFLQEARMPEGWMRKKFFIKPKFRRHQKKWAGVLKRKRRDFNYKLRWALKSMTRCATIDSADPMLSCRMLLMRPQHQISSY
jgi:hypothetical protein